MSEREKDRERERVTSNSEGTYAGHARGGPRQLERARERVGESECENERVCEREWL